MLSQSLHSLSLSGERVCMVMVSTLALSSGVNLSRNRPASELIYNSGGSCGRLCAKNSCRRGLRKIHDLVFFLFFAWNNLGSAFPVCAGAVLVVASQGSSSCWRTVADRVPFAVVSVLTGNPVSQSRMM